MTRLITEIFALKFEDVKYITRNVKYFFMLLQTGGIINIIKVHFWKSM